MWFALEFLGSSLIALLATSLGSFVAAFAGERLPPSLFGLAICTATGMMLGCSVVLVVEATHLSMKGGGEGVEGGFVGMQPVAGLTLGFLSMLCCERLVKASSLEASSMELVSFKGESTSLVRVMVILTSMMLHSVGEGISLGMSALPNESQEHLAEGSTSSLRSLVFSSISIHNIPEGAALALAFLTKGLSPLQSALLAVLANLPQPVSALFTFSLMQSSLLPFLPLGLGVASGCMLYAVLFEVGPEALEALGDTKKTLLLTALTTVGVVAIDALSHFG